MPTNIERAIGYIADAKVENEDAVNLLKDSLINLDEAIRLLENKETEEETEEHVEVEPPEYHEDRTYEMGFAWEKYYNWQTSSSRTSFGGMFLRINSRGRVVVDYDDKTYIAETKGAPGIIEAIDAVIKIRMEA